MEIRVLLVEDQKLLIEGLRSVMATQERIEIVGDAANGYEAVQSTGNLSPDVVLMDVAMPDMNGIEATRRILKSQPNIRILGLSVHEDLEHIRKMIAAGARGYLVKDRVYDEIFEAITTLYHGGYYFDSKILPQILEDYAIHIRHIIQQEQVKLTSREREVLQLIAEGYTTRQIARKLDLSESTVESHRYNLSQKLNINSIAGLTRYAIQQGIISP